MFLSQSVYVLRPLQVSNVSSRVERNTDNSIDPHRDLRGHRARLFQIFSPVRYKRLRRLMGEPGGHSAGAGLREKTEIARKKGTE